MSIIVKKPTLVPHKREDNRVVHKDEFFWVKDDKEGYRVVYPNGGYAVLRPAGEKWEFQVSINPPAQYIGTRDTLEDAYKTADDYIYRQNKDYWLHSRSKIISDTYAHVLPEVEDYTEYFD